MRFALQHYPFDTFTIVDSDQLAVRSGYSAYLQQAGVVMPEVGLLSNQPQRQPAATSVYPAQTAHAEFALWQPLLRRFPDGEQKFVHWSFWPSTVFLAGAARDLVRLYDHDQQVQTILHHSRIWATEEVILPTLVALLGYHIKGNPCSHDYVRYRVDHHMADLQAMLRRKDVYWIHPVPRQEYDPIRRHIREVFHEYQTERADARQVTRPVEHQGIAQAAPNINGGDKPPEKPEQKTAENLEETEPPPKPSLLLALPILQQMQRVEGWLEEDEADLLLAATAEALRSLPAPQAVVEVGSYLGRSTIVLGSVVKAIAPQAFVYAVDPHEGQVGAADQYMHTTAPTLARFQRNLAQAGLSKVVIPIQQLSYEVVWEQPIAFLLIDGLHDYVNVARDFHHFAHWVTVGGFIAFHDYADYYPGVKRFVNELLAQQTYRAVACARSLIVIQKVSKGKNLDGEEVAAVTEPAIYPEPTVLQAERGKDGNPQAVAAVPLHTKPLVSCIMPTYNRRPFVAQAIHYYLRQDYPNKELIILDDGTDPVADLVPHHPSIHYEQLPARQSMGAKHNLACEQARGDMVVHWDDDDWAASWRLSYQVESLMAHPEAQLCGLAALLFYDPRRQESWQYSYPAGQRPWVCGNTFCYHRRLWEKYRHPEINEGADTQYVWGLPRVSVLQLSDSQFLVGLIHGGNTSPKQPQAPLWHPYPVETIGQIMGEDWGFYNQLVSV
jgi:hypothetical protein